MDIAVVGTPEFTLGFQLAGVTRLHNPADLEETANVLRSLDGYTRGRYCRNRQTSDLTQMPEKLRFQLSESITPTVLGIGTEEDNTLRESIKSALELTYGSNSRKRKGSEKMSEEKGLIYRISGPVVTAVGITPRMWAEVVRVGDEGLMGEVIELHGDQSVIQVYEETSGIKPGEPVIRTGQTLSVQLCPGLLTQIYDGIQRPLEDLEETMGAFITRGVDADGLDLKKKWEFNATASKGDEVDAGHVIGTVQETETIEHRVMVPPGKSGTIKSIKSGEFDVTQTVCTLDDGTEIAMMQEWPVRTPRPFVRKYAPDVPLITGQRILDFLFPSGQGWYRWYPWTIRKW